tara:strand:- start:285 stop:803 length:519 start_codon:yes stop_codon:yes gene_type:complete
VDRQQKKEAVAKLNEQFNEAGVVVLTHYTGLNVTELTELRKKAAQLGAKFSVVKNRLAKIAANDTPYDQLGEQFKGPTAIAYSEDPVAAAKLVVEFAKNNEKLVIVAGAIADQVLDVDGIKSLAKMPSLDELRATLVGMINTPAQRIVGVLSAPAGQVARVINAHAEAQSSE